MSTLKFLAYATRISNRYQSFPIVDESGRKFSPIRSRMDIGDKCFLGCRINNHHGEFAKWELWEHTVGVEEYIMAGKKVKFPKTWFRGKRQLFELVIK